MELLMALAMLLNLYCLGGFHFLFLLYVDGDDDAVSFFAAPMAT
jgi:hypothetical protein